MLAVLLLILSTLVAWPADPAGGSGPAIPADTTDAAVVTLVDGRRLGYAEYGDPAGWPVFFFHAEQESRLSARFMDTTATAMGLRIIAPDRPGMGLSDFKESRTLLTWPEDVAALADQLGIERFSVLGFAGGGAHALACAYRIPNRLARVVVVNGVSPYVGGVRGGMALADRIRYWMASLRIGILLRTAISREYAGLRDDPEATMQQMRDEWPVPDRTLFRRRPRVLRSILEASLESFRNGVDGVFREWRLFTRPWGFRLQEVRTPVTLWYGRQDVRTPPDMGRYLDHFLPSSTLHLVDDAAHYSLLHDHLREILDGVANVE